VRRFITNYFYHHQLRRSLQTYWHISSIVVKKEYLSLGRYVYIGSEAFINAEGGIDIGDGSILSSKVTILSSSHEFKDSNVLPYSRKFNYHKVTIGKGVWIGYGVTILPGVNIGDGAIVGACSVVTKNIGVGEVCAGNPAKVISTRNISDISKLLESESFLNKCYPRKWKFL
jgi:acetyltransferase-like isoleucine patch superfamily enzyme